ncbi:MAG: hypothetical protein HRU24_18370 [Gammaproteobacteria bacterium]|nr:hypothetical protein [Gammaproteobacteria bacterium]
MASSEKITHWQSIFKSQIDSGLTISAFCKQQKINISTYYSWRKRLAEPEPSIVKKQQVVPLFVSESIMPQTSSLMIKTPSGYHSPRSGNRKDIAMLNISLTAFGILPGDKCGMIDNCWII